MEYKELLFEVKELKEQDNSVLVSGYASVYDVVDYYSDVVVRGAFDAVIAEFRSGKRNIPVLYEHDEPIGKVVGLDEDAKGLYVDAVIYTDIPEGQKTATLLKRGILNGLSIGYVAQDYVYEGNNRILKKLDLWEVSIVKFPANPLAKVTEVKKVVPFQDLPLADIDTPWDADKARHNVAKWASKDGSGEKDTIDWDKYKKAFLWYDEEKPDNFTSYKLPIADVFDGRLKAVPRAIFAAAAVLQGARGGVNIPDDEIEAIKRHLERYYEKMDRTPPWKEKRLDLVEFAANLTIGVLGSGLLEEKEGRVLSSRNARLLKLVADAITQLLKAAGYLTEEQDQEQNQEQRNIEEELAKALQELLNELKS